VFEIGATLREARVRRRLTLQQVEDDTKIRVKYLQAMENEEFDSLPGDTYAKGFLRSYAAYLALDADVILDEYRSRYRPGTKSPFSGSSALRPRHHRRRSGLAFAALVAVLILALIYVIGLRSDHASSNAPINPAALQSPTPTPAHSGLVSSSPSATRVATTGESIVSIVATGACYIDVRRDGVAGTPLFQGTLASAQNKTFTTKGTLAISVGGNPSNLRITVNDQPVHTSGDKTGTVYVINGGKVSKH
jgi:cytoskeleton protein RodZ